MRAVFDVNGFNPAFYEDGNSPSGAVSVTDAQWQAILSDPAHWRWDGANVVAYVPPAPPLPVPLATPYQIALALNVQGSGPSAAFDAATVKAKPSDRNRWKARTDPMPADNPVLVRLCGLAGIDPVPLHALAVQQ